MKRKIILILLAACLGLTACQGQLGPGSGSGDRPASDTAPATEATQPETEPGATDVSEAPVTEPVPTLPVPELPASEGMGFTALDNQLIAFLRENGLEQESFTVSPLSLKAALMLTALGAEGETQRQILDALGFAELEDMIAWYNGVLQGIADFDERIFDTDKLDCAYRIVNAVFHNQDCDGEFRESYKQLVEDTMAARASSHAAQEITTAINDWVSEQTNGLIKNLVQDASQSACVLVNALYLKTKWTEAFADSPLSEFTTAAGTVVQKDFITKTDRFLYYEDESCQLVVLPMQGGASMVLVLGDGRDLARKYDAAEPRKVCVSLPKFEVETSLDEKELVNCLKQLGCSRMFADSYAEFDPMFTQGIFVDDIIQKAKVKVDEKGLEAAAATAVIMVRNTALPNPETPVAFTADHPFQFLICREDEKPELLFWGQIMD